MKTCAYCGRENDDGAAQCHECGGTAFKSPEVDSGSSKAEDAASTVPTKIEFEPLKAEEVNQPWVTLLRCARLIDADLIATRLRAAEIPVFIPDEFLIQTISFNPNTFGFVRVQVPPTQYEAARERLSAD